MQRAKQVRETSTKALAKVNMRATELADSSDILSFIISPVLKKMSVIIRLIRVVYS